jgi:hypothetical protein
MLTIDILGTHKGLIEQNDIGAVLVSYGFIILSPTPRCF